MKQNWKSGQNLKNLTQFKLVETLSNLSILKENSVPSEDIGDGQVPEGFYQVESFNPQSQFYLALRVNYPNKADLLKGNTANPGGDIMIHGNCVTIGCMPLTDDKIKEVYVMAVEARNSGQQIIPIHIFPTELNTQGMTHLKSITTDASKINFWTNLQQGFTFFETYKLIPKISIDKNGDYMVN